MAEHNLHVEFKHTDSLVEFSMPLVSRPAKKLYCAKKYRYRHFVLQAGIYIHLMRKNVLYKY